MSDKSQEKDWKLFRSRLPAWQESYMDRLNHQYIQLLSSEGKPSVNSGHWTSGSGKIRSPLVFRYISEGHR